MAATQTCRWCRTPFQRQRGKTGVLYCSPKCRIAFTNWRRDADEAAVQARLDQERAIPIEANDFTGVLYKTLADVPTVCPTCQGAGLAIRDERVTCLVCRFSAIVLPMLIVAIQKEPWNGG